MIFWKETKNRINIKKLENSNEFQTDIAKDINPQ